MSAPHSPAADYICLSWRDSCCTGDPDDPSRYLLETCGLMQWYDDHDNEAFLGKFRIFYLDRAGATEAGVGLFDVLDTNSATTDYFPALFGSDAPAFHDRVLRLSGSMANFGANLLIVDRMEIVPAFRGRSLGLVAVRELIARFSMGAAVVALKPFPLQFEHAMGYKPVTWEKTMQLDLLPTDQQAATAKLIRHFATMGFAHLSRTPFMVRSAWT